jgi:C1A family cysteine protease
VKNVDDEGKFHGMGWLRDYSDFRDFTAETETLTPGQKMAGHKLSINAAREKLKIAAPVPALPLSVDLRPWCSPVEDQGSMNSCTANAAAGIYEYFERYTKGTWVDVSRRFIWKTTKDLLGWSGNVGAFLRTTMGSLVLFGAPPEKYWPYISDPSNPHFDDEPSAFPYILGQSFQCLSYFRYDPPGVTAPNLLANVKNWLAAKWPCMFGFTVFGSMAQCDIPINGVKTASIPLPAPRGDINTQKGHAVCAVGYNDSIKIQNRIPGSPQTTGALLIRNSWGTQWGGMGGYLWMPYDYVLAGLTSDWWTMYNAEWVNTGLFGFP